MSKEKNEQKENKPKKDEHAIMMACCPEDEDVGKIKEKVLQKIREQLEDRSNAIMTRLNDEDLTQIDALVEIEVFKSRSEAAAFFIKEGMQARKDLLQKVMPSVEKIRELKAQAKKSLVKE